MVSFTTPLFFSSAFSCRSNSIFSISDSFLRYQPFYPPFSHYFFIYVAPFWRNTEFLLLYHQNVIYLFSDRRRSKKSEHFLLRAPLQVEFLREVPRSFPQLRNLGATALFAVTCFLRATDLLPPNIFYRSRSCQSSGPFLASNSPLPRGCHFHLSFSKRTFIFCPCQFTITSLSAITLTPKSNFFPFFPFPPTTCTLYLAIVVEI